MTRRGGAAAVAAPVVSCVLCGDEGACMVLNCGAAYCKGNCAVHLFDCVTAHANEMPRCGCPKCHKGGGGSGHLDRLVDAPDAEGLRFLQANMRPERFKALCVAMQAARKGATRPCPTCQNACAIGLNAKVYVCPALGCINPEFGYCVACDKGVTDVAKHSCGDDEAALRAYLATNADAIHPCPACGEGFEKIPGGCDHVSCPRGCKGTDGNPLRYCGACGKIFALNSSGTAVYDHVCDANPHAAPGSVHHNFIYGMTAGVAQTRRDVIARRYLGGGAGPSSG